MIKPAASILAIGLLLAAAASCEFPTVTEVMTRTETPRTDPPSTGEIQLVVTSVAGAGIDPNRVRVEFVAVSVDPPGRSWNGNAVGIAAPITLRVLTGSYRLWASLQVLDYTRLGYRYGCGGRLFGVGATVAEGQRTVVQESFTCLQPGGAQVRTSITGVDPALKLRVQLAEEAGVCDLELSEDLYTMYYNLYRVFPVAQIGSRTQGPMWPGSYRMNLCGLPPSCPISGTSQAFSVKEDELTDVLFTVRCPDAAGGGA